MSGPSRRVALVAEREIRESVRSRSFRIVTVILVIASLAAVVVPAIVGDDGPSTTRIAVAGGPAGLPAALTAAGAAAGTRVVARPADPARAREDVATGRADAAVIAGRAGAPARVVVDEELPADVRATVMGGLSAAGLREALEEAGLDPGRIAALTRDPRIEVVALDPEAGTRDGDAGVGVLVAVVLYLALMFAGSLLASGVAEEKTSRVSEVLLASVRPIDLLLGKVIGIGLVGLAQLAVAAAPALVAALAIGAVDLPAATATAVGWGLVWFVVGYALYAAAYAALGALVGRQQEVGRVTAPLTMLLLAGYLGAIYAVSEPDGALTVGLSLVPPLSPLVMPVRIAAGAADPAQIALALVLCLALALAILIAGARVYRTGITRTGARTPLREALRATGRGRPHTA